MGEPLDRVHGSLDGERCGLQDIQPKPPSAGTSKYSLLVGGQHVQTEKGLAYWLSYLTVMMISFVGFIDYSVIMPSAKDYCVTDLGTSNSFYGLSLATYPLSRILFLPLAGLAADTVPMKVTLMFTVFLQICGGLGYGLAEAADSPALLILGRVVTGVGSTNIATVQYFIVRNTPTENQSRAIAAMQAVNFLGIALGPALNFVLASADFTLLDGVQFNKYTGAGFMLAGFHCLNMTLVILLFRERSSASAQKGNTKPTSCAGLVQGYRAVWQTKGAMGVMFSAMLAMLWLSLLETLINPITKESFGWNLQRISVFFAIFAVLAALLMAVTGICSKCIPDRTLVLLSTPLYGIGGLIALFKIRHTNQASLLWFYTLSGIISAGFTFQNAPSMGLFTKLMSGSEYEGMASSVALQMQGFGRTLGPLIAGASLDSGGIQMCTYILFGLLAVQVMVIARNWRYMHFAPGANQTPRTSFLSTPVFVTPSTSPGPGTPTKCDLEEGLMKSNTAQDQDQDQILAGSASPVDDRSHMLPNLTGVWEHVFDDEDAMAALFKSVGVLQRETAQVKHPKLKIQQTGDNFDIVTEGTAGAQHTTFRVREVFHEMDETLQRVIPVSTRWETEVGEPVKFHQYSLDDPERGVRRWLQQTPHLHPHPNNPGGDMWLVQELAVSDTVKARRYFRPVEVEPINSE